MTLPNDVTAALITETQPEAPQPGPELPPGVELPYEVHCTASDGSVMACGQVLSYGDEMLIDQGTIDREGAAAARVIELVEDRAAQRRLFGSIRLRRGGWPAGVSKILLGSRRWEMNRANAYARADRMQDPRESEIAQCAAKAEYGARIGTPPFAAAYGQPGFEGPEQ